MAEVDEMAETANNKASSKDNNITEYQQQIASLKEQCLAKNLEMEDLQRGLEAQVRMVMELEDLEQKEHQDYDKKLEASKQLIHELGERVGQESKSKAELASILGFTQIKCEEQATQMDHWKGLSEANAELLAAVKKDDANANTGANASRGDSNKWQVYGKLEYMMETNQKLVTELAQAQADNQMIRKDGSDKELLCLELSSQLDKLASQLNDSDELMAAVKTNLESKQDELRECKARVTMLEKSLMESGDDGDHDRDGETTGTGDTKGKALLLQQLKEKEEQCGKMRRERDAGLAKATKLSLALASTRELNDILQEKLGVPGSFSDRFFQKSPVAASPSNQKQLKSTPPGMKLATPTLGTPQRHSSGDNNDNNANALAAAASAFDGRRLRNFFGRKTSSNSMTPATTPPTPASTTSNAIGINSSASNSNNNDDNTPPSGTQGNLSKSRLFQRNTSASSEQSNVGANGGNAADSGVSTQSKDNNPFDDDLNASFSNPSIGKASHIDEHVQGGGGDVNLALTL